MKSPVFLSLAAAGLALAMAAPVPAPAHAARLRNAPVAPQGFPPTSGGDEFGDTILCQDFTGDGVAELIVGSPGGDAVYVYDLGNPKPLFILRPFDGPPSGFGAALAAGDINGDGRPELLVGAPTAQNEEGVAVGGVNRFDFIDGEPVHVGIQLGTVAGGNFGDTLLICDLGRDGRNEVMIGAPAGDAEPPRPGTVSIFHPGQVILRTLVGETAGDEFGDELLCCDLNGDGLGELVISAESASPGQKAGAGAVYVYQGRSAQQLRLRGRLNGARAGDHFGDSLTCYRVGGGLRRQSHNLLVGAEGVQETGSYSMFNGLNLGRQFTRAGRSPGEEFGVSLAPCRVTRGRVPVTLIGAEESNAGAGRAYLYDLSGRFLRALDPPDEFNPGHFGATVACCDWDGDGVDDLLIAAEGTEEDNGAIYILSGIDASLLAILSGPLFA